VAADTLWLLDKHRLPSEPDIDVLALDQALDQLARLDPRPERMIELRLLGGLAHEEIAKLMGMSLTSAKREWQSAKSCYITGCTRVD
jgi:DNA-directed RNA polymerase specialized sigma24 family protein